MILLEGVAAAAGGRIVERQAEIVASQKPLESALRPLQTTHNPWSRDRLPDRRRHGVRLERLLVETRRSPPRCQKPWQPIGRKCPAGAVWMSQQPAQRLEADLEHLGMWQSSGRSRISAWRELRIVVGGACARTTASPPRLTNSPERQQAFSVEHIAHSVRPRGRRERRAGIRESRGAQRPTRAAN